MIAPCVNPAPSGSALFNLNNTATGIEMLEPTCKVIDEVTPLPDDEML